MWSEAKIRETLLAAGATSFEIDTVFHAVNQARELHYSERAGFFNDMKTVCGRLCAIFDKLEGQHRSCLGP